ncbi:MAG: ImmA/IrrE family metallo-endopeptidase [Treponema sp.]
MEITKLDTSMELDSIIVNKLQKAFEVSKDDINSMLSFFNQNLCPEIQNHYLSHVVSTISDIINTKRKEEIKKQLESTPDKAKEIQSQNVRFFTIELKPMEDSIKNNKKAFINMTKQGAIIYYKPYLKEYEKRFVIAHELGHIVDRFLLNNEKKENVENRASLFAYIILLYKNNFYKDKAKDYIVKTDIELFNEFLKIVHNKKI